MATPDLTCSVPNCGRQGKLTRGMCTKHYQRWRRDHSDTPCSVEGCNDPAIARGMCNKHYCRFKSTGSTECVPRLSLEQRFWTKVTKGPNCWIWVGAKNRFGYGKIIVDEKYVGAHRVSWELEHGPIPDGMLIDHICHNPACVNPGHLRLATPKQNTEYRRGAQSNAISGVRGVRWHKRVKRWEAHVTHHGRQMFLGYFDTIEEADQAARAKRAELFTFPEVA